MSAEGPMPAGFIGHGSPMNTLEHNRYTCALDVGESLGKATPPSDRGGKLGES